MTNPNTATTVGVGIIALGAAKIIAWGFLVAIGFALGHWFIGRLSTWWGNKYAAKRCKDIAAEF